MTDTYNFNELCQLWYEFLSEREQIEGTDQKEQNQGADHPTRKGRGRGFAGMTLARRKEIAARGGRSSWARGHAHTWTKQEAIAAGKRSGETRRKQSEVGHNGTISI